MGNGHTSAVAVFLVGEAAVRDASRFTNICTFNLVHQGQALRKNPIIASYTFLANIFKQSTLQ